VRTSGQETYICNESSNAMEDLEKKQVCVRTRHMSRVGDDKKTVGNIKRRIRYKHFEYSVQHYRTQF
jgi:hypothetical protein